MTLQYDRTTNQLRWAAGESEEEDIDLREIQVADYIVFILALETYMGWLLETTGGVDPDDATLVEGIRLARFAERQNMDAMSAFIRSNLVSKQSVTLLDAAIRPPPTPKGLGIRALKLRILLSKGGVATAKAIFGTSAKARREVLEAIEASKIDDPDAALNKFAVLTLKNKRLEAWIDQASAVVPPNGTSISSVQEATKGASDSIAAVLAQRVEQDAAPATDSSVASRDAQAAAIKRVEVESTEAARKAIARSGESDAPLTRSESIGLVTATVTAISSDPEKPENIPPALASLSPEQRIAAMTGGKVRVSAGAGSGKSTTLLARVKYLLDQGAQPNRIIAMSFNKKAADELGEKLAGKIGSDKVTTSKTRKSVPDGVQVGTMHSTFLNGIFKYGTPEQRNIFASVQGKGGMIDASKIFKTVKDMWAECFDGIDRDPPGSTDPKAPFRQLSQEEMWKMPPKSGRMTKYLNVFQGQGMSMDQVRAWVAEQDTPEAFQAMKFYELYEGLKGALGPSWKPDLCGDKPSLAATKFIDKNRAGKPRIGDFNDMLTVFRDIMKANPAARKSFQRGLDHILVDECQDLNPLQFEVLQLMTEHIKTDDTKRSFWMVGDDKQCIYQFRGAEPENFIQLDKKYGFKDRQLTMNYRCAPEFVDAANKLIANNKNQIKMTAVPKPDRARGEASLIVRGGVSAEKAASEFGAKILQARKEGRPLEDFAVLARTNAELAVYQQVCAVTGTPYVQKKATSVFSSPESTAFRAFMNATVAMDPKVSRETFVQVLISGGLLSAPFADGPKEKEEALVRFNKKALGLMAEYCKKFGLDYDDFDPIEYAMVNQNFMVFFYMNMRELSFERAEDATAEATALMTGISLIRSDLATPGKLTSEDLFQQILALPLLEKSPPTPGATGPARYQWTTQQVTLRESTKARITARNQQTGEDFDAELTPEESDLGSLLFVRMMMQPNPADPTYNPANPSEFYARYEGLAAEGNRLRIDPDEWEDEQIKAGIVLADRKAPPGVYLGTVHSTKGAEWPDVTVLMSEGRFPAVRRKRHKDPREIDNEIPEVELLDPATVLEAERRLGYVALTRAKTALTIIYEAEPSPFVKEAGLLDGQNVIQPQMVTPGAVFPTVAPVDPADAPVSDSPNPPDDTDIAVDESVFGDLVETTDLLDGMGKLARRLHSKVKTRGAGDTPASVTVTATASDPNTSYSYSRGDK